MEHLLLSMIIWLTVFILIPFSRIKELSIVFLVSIIWMIFVDNISIGLGYYNYHNILIPIGKTPLFHLLALSGIGMLMINWLKENSFTKLLAVLIVTIVFLLLQSIYIKTGAFSYGSFDILLSSIHSIAALSIFVWLSLASVGEQKVYSGHKSRVRIKRLA